MLTTFDYSNKTNNSFKSSKTTEIRHFKSKYYSQKVLKLFTPMVSEWVEQYINNSTGNWTALVGDLRRIRFSYANQHNAIIIVANISINYIPLGRISIVIETLSCRLSSITQCTSAAWCGGVGEWMKNQSKYLFTWTMQNLLFFQMYWIHCFWPRLCWRRI